MQRRSILTMLLIGLGAAIAGVLVARLTSHAPLVLEGGTWLPQPRAVADFHLYDQNGRPRGAADLRGHPTLLFFGFTYCPDVCPTTLATLNAALARRPLPGLQVLFVSVDPERDSAAVIGSYLAAFNREFIGLRGDAQALQPLLQSLGAIALRQPLGGGGYTVDHTATLFLVDTRGRLAAVFTPPYSAERLAADFSRIARADRL
ncbi:MAG: SCO family protein [Gammaproteobacteria bacterium]|nr:SCO family protein [Gammaproteobacteria bacterium]